MIRFIGFAFGVSVVIGMVCLAGCDSGGQKPQTQETPQREKKEVDQEFFTYLEKLSQDQNQKQKYVGIIEKLAQVVEEEAKKNPQAMSSHVEEIMRLVPKVGPGVALQFEEFASEALKSEMKHLREDAKVVKLIELEKENLRLNKEIKEVREKEKVFSTKVPVLLHGWSDAIAVFSITNVSKQEQKRFMTPAGKNPYCNTVVFFEPGEYVVEFFASSIYTDQEIPKGKSTFLVMPESKYNYDGVSYHGVVIAPGILAEK